VTYPQTEEIAMGLDADDGLGDGAQQQQHSHDLVQSAQVLS
jgi:hypothetical protein